ncbi:Signal transduction histidine kinase [Quadrisphaera granulorum]|uniref:histidine kinase n=1 Tax=Quadrisphaera granulorum TaxID=317664 RepID=A0A316A7B5_9ACTN|nr:histidine kinase [Quadrisphaera granulorum]PWJ52870.1 signal transduction histidine kinase [Quadrisphaera granulorum]SZE97252.1 Signal transduction histidine kinase [Quadrisphaera granulorum]
MDFWERSRVGWHAAWYGVLAVTAVAVLALAGAPLPERLTAVAALTAAAVLYGVVGTPLLTDRCSMPGYALYTAGIAACLVVLSLALSPGLALAPLFVFFPQAWAMTPRRAPAVVVVIVVPAALGLVQLGQAGWTLSAVPDALATAFLQSAAAIVLGLWITGLVRESDERASLLAELTATRAELASAEHARGVLAERERMAAEIHDTLAQGFLSIVALAQAAQDGETRQRLELIEATARANLAEARAIVAAHTPPDLTGAEPGARLLSALERLAARTTATDGTAVDLDLPTTLPTLSSEAEVVLLRAAQEGLGNARRHGAATHATVALAVDVEGVELTVTDDGTGFRDHEGPRIGYGLAAMAARAAQVGGSAELTARTDGGAGCVLRVRVPA